MLKRKLTLQFIYVQNLFDDGKNSIYVRKCQIDKGNVTTRHILSSLIEKWFLIM